MAKSNFIETIISRGYLHQATNIEALDEKCKSKRITAYIGFDCTANSLHVGSLMQIMMLRVLQKSGHKPIVLMGGGTTKIGDPSGKDNSRPLLSTKKIQENKDSIKKTFENFLDFNDSENGALMIDNSEWLDKIKLISFLRNFGKHFSVNRMLSMDSIKLRLDREQPLSFIEFNYAILQAYDFLELNRRNNCVLQMGGSDQWGNIVTGVDLTRRVDGKEIFGLTSPLITTSSGSKMGKTANGAIWLNHNKLDPYDFWQFWRNTEDNDVKLFLKIFTELPLNEISRLSLLQGNEINYAKIILANEATKLCHGSDASKEAELSAKKVFQKGEIGESIPNFKIKLQEDKGISLIEVLVISKLAASKGEARRLIKGGGAKINNIKIIDENHFIQKKDFSSIKKIKISSGKKRHISISI